MAVVLKQLALINRFVIQNEEENLQLYITVKFHDSYTVWHCVISVQCSLPRPLIQSWSCFKINKVSTATWSSLSFWRKKGGKQNFVSISFGQDLLKQYSYRYYQPDSQSYHTKNSTRSKKIQIWNNLKKYMNKLLELVDNSWHVFDSLIVTLIPAFPCIPFD